MLLESEAPLTMIAFDVGGGSLQYFSTLFRRHTGGSPSTFRAQHRS
jgi:AraC-like DNA-binding protein